MFSSPARRLQEHENQWNAKHTIGCCRRVLSDVTQWVGFAGSCTVFFHVLEFFLWKAGSHICNAPWHKNEIKTRSKRDQTESETRAKQDHRSSVEDFGIFWAHMCRTRAHKFTHFCTRSHQPTSALQTRKVSPGERKSKVPTRTSCSKRDVKSQDCETHCKRS